METGKFISLLLKNDISYQLDAELNTITVFTGSCMKQNYIFLHNPKHDTVRFSCTECKRYESHRFGDEIGRRFLKNLEFAPHRITGKRKEV